MPLERVRVKVGDTDAAPFSIDIGFGGSRSTNIGARAAIQACKELGEKLTPEAARMFDCPEDQVSYAAGEFYPRDNRRRGVSLGEVVAERGRPISVSTKVETPGSANLDVVRRSGGRGGGGP